MCGCVFGDPNTSTAKCPIIPSLYRTNLESIFYSKKNSQIILNFDQKIKIANELADLFITTDNAGVTMANGILKITSAKLKNNDFQIVLQIETLASSIDSIFYIHTTNPMSITPVVGNSPFLDYPLKVKVVMYSAPI